MHDVVLFFLNGPQQGLQVLIPPQGATLGRSRQAEICVKDGLLSRLHCHFSWENGSLCVMDLASSNGTFVNGVQLGKMLVRLQVGDQLLVGQTSLRVAQADVETASEGESPSPVHEPLPSEGDAVDLGLQPEALYPTSEVTKKRLPLWVWVAIGCMLVVVLGGALLVLPQAASQAPVRVQQLAPKEQPLEVSYERLKMTKEGLFRYQLHCLPSGEMTLEVIDLGGADRSFNKSRKLTAHAFSGLRKLIMESDYLAFQPRLAEQSLDGISLESYQLTIVLGRSIWEQTLENPIGRTALGDLCEKLELFAQQELGVVAVQYSIEELQQRAEEQLALAERYWDQRDIGDEKLAMCLEACQKGRAYLETLNPKPACATTLAGLEQQSEALLTKRYEALIFKLDQAKNTRQYAVACEVLQKIRQVIPDREDERHRKAEDELLVIEKRLSQGRR